MPAIIHVIGFAHSAALNNHVAAVMAMVLMRSTLNTPLSTAVVTAQPPAIILAIPITSEREATTPPSDSAPMAA
ncbi:Uncharacterised protein [Vibrio cholerae]|nr:Uncharacterised protein [Vibrio cholerae]CSC61778.1 Uncharacterised protein [Vibrio cholerae]